MEEKLTESPLVEAHDRISTPSDQPTNWKNRRGGILGLQFFSLSMEAVLWYYDFPKRKRELYRECMLAAQNAKEGNAKAIKSIIAHSVLNGGDVHFILSELFNELTDELKEIVSKLKLCKVDEELHKTCASTSESVTVRCVWKNSEARWCDCGTSAWTQSSHCKDCSSWDYWRYPWMVSVLNTPFIISCSLCSY